MSRPLLTGVAVLVAVVVGPWLAGVTVRLVSGDDRAAPSAGRALLTTVVFAALLAAIATWTQPRPAIVALGWLAGAGVVLAGVDLAVHRLPDRVTFPAAAVCGTALLVDAATMGTWGALVRAGTAAAVALGGGVVAAALSPAGLGFGDVKLLGLLGLVLGWAGWGVLLTGIFLGLLAGALGSLVLVAARRAGWRTAVPFGPPLLLGAAVALAVTGSLG